MIKIINKHKKLLFIIFIIFILISIKVNASELGQLEGEWEGEIRVKNNKLDVVIKFYKNNKNMQALIDIPQQKVYDYELQNLKVINDKIYFE